MGLEAHRHPAGRHDAGAEPAALRGRGPRAGHWDAALRPGTTANHGPVLRPPERPPCALAGGTVDAALCSWSTTIRCTRRQRWRHGWPTSRGSPGLFCRPPVPQPTRASALVARSMSAVPAISSGNASLPWWLRWKTLDSCTALGRINGQRAMTRLQSRRRSSPSPQRHMQTSPHECTKLVWTDLEVVSLVLHPTKQGPTNSRRNSRSDKNDCASPWEAMDQTSEHSS
jgi:hypothetical protein